MARIMIENLFKRVLNAPDETKTLLRHLQDNSIDWMHACGGKGRCTTCKVIVREGLEHFGPRTLPEEKYAREGALGPAERLACQATVTGNVTIAAPPEYQLPHMKYSDEH